MLFGAVLWYCSLVPFQTFSQQEAYEALSRYKNLFFIILINTNINIIINIYRGYYMATQRYKISL